MYCAEYRFNFVCSLLYYFPMDQMMFRKGIGHPPTQLYILFFLYLFQAITAVEKSGDEIVGEIIVWNKQNTRMWVK